MIRRWVGKDILDGEFSRVVTQQGVLGVMCESNLVITSFMVACRMFFRLLINLFPVYN